MRIGIDLGGTKTEIAVLNDKGEFEFRRREPTKRGSYSGILEQLVSLVHEVENKVEAECSVGVGIPGSISAKTGLVRNANTVELNGHALKDDLASALSRKVSVENDANCFALSEATDGAGASSASVFGVILGTGTGGGFVFNGQLISGANGIAGEWGHNPLPWILDDEKPGRDCYCGRRGCIETFLSGPGMAADYRRLTGSSLSAREISALADSGEVSASEHLYLYVNRLARALAQVCNIIDPDTVVLGGGLSSIKQLYSRLLPEMQPYIFSDQFDVKIVPPKFGDSSGVRGAAWLVQ